MGIQMIIELSDHQSAQVVLHALETYKTRFEKTLSGQNAT
jgi:hypothetical protein